MASLEEMLEDPGTKVKTEQMHELIELPAPVEQDAPEGGGQESYKNIEMERMLTQLQPLLGRTDLIGYAAARNTRILRSEAKEYLDLRTNLIIKYGSPKVGSDGRETGEYELRFDSPHWKKYEDEVSTWALIEHKPKIFKIKADEAVGKLTGQQMLDLEWMILWDDERTGDVR